MSRALTCIVCGRSYEACPRCTELEKHGVFAWKQLYDTQECFKLSSLVYDHSRGLISDEEAVDRLSYIDMDGAIPHDNDTYRYLDNLRCRYASSNAVEIPAEVESEEVVVAEAPKPKRKR